MADDHASWLNGHAIARLQILDRWHPRVSPHSPRPASEHDHTCGWCSNQFFREIAGKKFKPESECPWKNSTYKRPPTPSQTIPAAERWELIDVVRIPPPRRNRAIGDNGKIVHLGYYATREAAEAAKHRQSTPVTPRPA